MYAFIYSMAGSKFMNNNTAMHFETMQKQCKTKKYY